MAESEKGDTKENLGKLRIYGPRNEIDLVCLMKGNLPELKDEIAIDRMYADNNRLSVGDEICLGNRTLSICGLVAFSDYSCLFENNSDMMFDAVKFGVGLMTKEGFDAFGTAHLEYRYSFTYDEKPADEQAEKEQSDDFLDVLAKRVGMTLTDYIPRYGNQAINFTGDDMGSDRSMMLVLLYILIAIMAFVFAVTTNNTIFKEANVIGILRASGYTRGELLLHYILLPIIVTLAGALVGNILGYTWFKDIFVDTYYQSYSLTTYTTLWNGEAFVLTTVVPFIIMVVINVLLIGYRLRLSPLKFLRKDLAVRQKKKAVHLPGFKFFNRFRLRIIIQNMPNYITLFVGILFANILLLFGIMMTPLLDHYQNEIQDKLIAKHQYVLKVPVEVDNEAAEKYCVRTLSTLEGRLKSEDVLIYGIADDSEYVDINSSELKDGEVYVSHGYAEKFKINKGDKITLKEKYEDKEYTFTVKDMYDYPSAFAVFMDEGYFKNLFDKEDDYYSGYLSSEKLDIDEKYIATEITLDDLTKVSRQLDRSMGEVLELLKSLQLYYLQY